MSIIQDALKRKEEEQRQALSMHGEKVEKDALPPESPPKSVDKPSDKKDEKPPWKAVVLALLIPCLALVAVYFLVINGLGAFREPAPPVAELAPPADTVDTEDGEVDDAVVAEPEKMKLRMLNPSR